MKHKKKDMATSLRQRHLLQKTCQPVSRLPWKCSGPWEQTLERWHGEGLDGSWEEALGVEPEFNTVPVNLGYSPWFEEEILEDRGDKVVRRNEWGIVCEERKDGMSMPHWLDYPVKTRDDWRRIRDERLDPEDPERFPEDWRRMAESFNKDENRLTMLGRFMYGFFGTVRTFLGTEKLLTTVYDDPEWIHEMMDWLADFWITIYEKVAEKVKIDMVHIWEDMAGKGGALISPRMIRDFMLPNYVKIKRFVDKHNIGVFSFDSDGSLKELVPLFHSVGVNRFIPFEVAAGNDVLEFRHKFPKICISGGIDKRVLTADRQAWRPELHKVREMLKRPGYEPAIDHGIPPDVSWRDFYDFHMQLKDIMYQ